MSEVVAIASDVLEARIDPLGAELVSLTDPGARELMTDADPAFWTGHAPILFPIVGRLAGDRYRIGRTEYPMAQHGFARRRRFEVAERTASSATFVLRADADTRAIYPFDFVFHVEHRVVGATYRVEAWVENCGSDDLPASIGFHPAFAWPLPFGASRAAHRIVFADDEPGTLRQIGADGTLLARPRPSPLVGRTLPLSDALFERDALIWDPVHSRSVRYDAGAGPGLRVDFPGLDRLGIWTKPGARFVCIEPWDGIADPAGFAGEIWDKPGIHRVPPGGLHRATMSVTLEG